MVPLDLFRSPVVVACVLTGFSIKVAFHGVAFVLSLYFQRVLGEPAITAGLLFLPMTGLLTVANLASARVTARRGHHVPVRAGLAGGLFNATRQTGGALAVAVFGALVSGSFMAGSFMTGMRDSMLISGTLLLLSTVCTFTLY